MILLTQTLYHYKYIHCTTVEVGRITWKTFYLIVSSHLHSKFVRTAVMVVSFLVHNWFK